MKQHFISAFLVLSAVSCSDFNQIGDAVDTQKAISIKEALKEHQSKGTTDFTVFGRVKEVCQSEGCWFSYDLHDKTITVDFDEKFTVPKSIGKKDLYAVGRFYQDTIWNDEMDETTADSSVSNFELQTKFLATGVRFK